MKAGVILLRWAADSKEVAMYSIGVDFHKAYSHITVLDVQGVTLKAGKVPNTAEAGSRVNR